MNKRRIPHHEARPRQKAQDTEYRLRKRGSFAGLVELLIVCFQEVQCTSKGCASYCSGRSGFGLFLYIEHERILDPNDYPSSNSLRLHPYQSIPYGVVRWHDY
ncbi:MAG: hypothetical protein LW721_11500 [Flammeovirgaceae bacterium]|nr:hypothetical protein [Flammeovirgaceae bacterium]